MTHIAISHRRQAYRYRRIKRAYQIIRMYMKFVITHLSRLEVFTGISDNIHYRLDVKATMQSAIKKTSNLLNSTRLWRNKFYGHVDYYRTIVAIAARNGKPV